MAQISTPCHIEIPLVDVLLWHNQHLCYTINISFRDGYARGVSYGKTPVRMWAKPVR